MREVLALCPNCFIEKTSNVRCPKCGFEAEERPFPSALPPGTFLGEQYVVGHVLGRPGGFGITYLAWDRKLRTRVAIKEFFPRDFVTRDPNGTRVVPHSVHDGENYQYGLSSFQEEASTLAQFDHANVVRVRTVFRQNDTAYLVMYYYEGMTLSDYVEIKGHRLPEKMGVDILIPVLDGLTDVHDRGFLHRDLKPQNIYLTKGGRPILLDFGSARQALGDRSRSLSVVLTPGYAAFEQYHRRGMQGPWTDVYGAGATLYRLLTGETPPPATERVAHDDLKPPAQLRSDISQQVSDATMWALALESDARPQSAGEFRDALLGAEVPDQVAPVSAEEEEALEVAPEPMPDTPLPSPSPKKSGRKKAGVVFAGVTALGTIIAAGAYMMQPNELQVVGDLTVGESTGFALGSGDADRVDGIDRRGSFVQQWNIWGERDVAVRIEMASNAFDPYLIVSGPGVFTPIRDDDGGDGNAARIDLTFPSTGQYRVYATTRYPESTGPYTIRVHPGVVFAGAVTVGQASDGELSASDAVELEGVPRQGQYLQVWSLDGNSGDSIQLDLESDDFDAFLFVRGPGLPDPLSDNNGGANTNARIALRLPQDGQFEVVASTGYPGETGAYRLRARAPLVPAGVLPGTGAVTGTLSEDDPLEILNVERTGARLDAWTLNGRAGQRVQIDLTSADFDPYLMVSGPGLTNALRDNDGGGDTGSRLTLRFPQSGQYTVLATTYYANVLGDYTLRVTPQSDPQRPTVTATRPTTTVRSTTTTSNLATRGTVSIGGRVSGTLTTADPTSSSATTRTGRHMQAWSFRAQGGQTYQFDLTSSAFDTHVSVVGPGLSIQSDDDGGDDTNSRLTVMLPQTGTYQIIVSTFSEGVVGAYTLRAHRINRGGYSNSFSSASALDLPSNTTNCTRSITSGSLFVHGRGTTSSCQVVLWDVGIIPSNTRIEVNARRLSGPRGGPFGLTFGRNSAADTYYAAFISDYGSAKISQYDGSRASGERWIELADWSTSSAIRTGDGSTNTMVLEIRGRTVSLRVNGTVVRSITAAEEITGYVGLFNNGNDLQTRFDDLSIR